MKHLTSILSAAALVAAPAAAQVDDFENGNPNGWFWNGFAQTTVPTTGGNPGGYCEGLNMFTLAPVLSSGASAGAPFVGDYRAMGVTDIKFDAQYFMGNGGAPMAILLRDESGTPGSQGDDNIAFYVDLIQTSPMTGTGWNSYSMPIDSAATSLPTGWQAGNGFNLTGGFTGGYDWNDLIQDVDVIEIHFIDPTWFGITQSFSAGVDNIELVMPAGPQLSVIGTCGTVGSGMLAQGATPNGLVGFAWSQSVGSFVIGGAACVGTTVDLVNPNAIAVVSADANDNAAVLPGNGIPAAGCGVVNVQALDITTCTTTNVVSL